MKRGAGNGNHNAAALQDVRSRLPLPDLRRGNLGRDGEHCTRCFRALENGHSALVLDTCLTRALLTSPTHALHPVGYHKISTLSVVRPERRRLAREQALSNKRDVRDPPPPQVRWGVG